MTESTDAAALPRTARILHGAIVVGLLALLGVFYVLARSTPLSPTPFAEGADVVLRLVGAGLGVGVLIAARALRRQMIPLEPHGDEAAWWQTYLPRAIAIWAIAEAAGIAGGVFWWVSGDAVLGLGLGGVALAILLWTSPARLRTAVDS